jgi:hypothetical protein
MSKQTDLAWIAYKKALKLYIPVDHMELPPTNYIDSITIWSLVHHYKNNTLAKKNFNGMKEAWNAFVKERPDGNYTIVGSGDYIIDVAILNNVFKYDYYNARCLLKKAYNTLYPKNNWYFSSSFILPIIFGALVGAIFIKFVVF